MRFLEIRWCEPAIYISAINTIVFRTVTHLLSVDIYVVFVIIDDAMNHLAHKSILV